MRTHNYARYTNGCRCDLCRAAVREERADARKRRSTGDFPCPEKCGRTFMTQKGADQHASLIHRDPGVFGCGICELWWSTDAELLEHMRGVHGSL